MQVTFPFAREGWSNRNATLWILETHFRPASKALPTLQLSPSLCLPACTVSSISYGPGPMCSSTDRQRQLSWEGRMARWGESLPTRPAKNSSCCCCSMALPINLTLYACRVRLYRRLISSTLHDATLKQIEITKCIYEIYRNAVNSRGGEGINLRTSISISAQQVSKYPSLSASKTFVSLWVTVCVCVFVILVEIYF